jgi:uncharacterized membrane protein YeaQ/YmgE (transglycosylase-associated protein family)
MLIFALLGIGILAGWVAQMVLPIGRRKVDWGEAIVVGLIGTFVGGMLFSFLWGDGLKIRPSGISGSITGAIIVQFVWRLIRPKVVKPAPAPPAHRGRVTPKRR